MSGRDFPYGNPGLFCAHVVRNVLYLCILKSKKFLYHQEAMKRRNELGIA